MKRAALIIAVVAAALTFVSTVDAGGHTLIVDGTSYDSTHEAGPTIHWETPGANPTSASFAERGQVWDGNGSEHLPCEHGVHWISNENTLNVSHCLEGPEPSTTTLAPTTTSTTTTISTTSSPTTTSSLPATTTTVPATTSSTSSPATTSVPATTSPSTTALPSTSTSPSTAAPTTVASGPTSTLSSPTTSAPPTSPRLPVTGNGNWMAVAIGSAFIALGALMLRWKQRYG